MKKRFLRLGLLFIIITMCISSAAIAADDGKIVITVNSGEGYRETGGKFVESNLTGFDGGKSKYAGAETAAAFFYPDIERKGSYRVSVYNINNSNAAVKAEIAVKHSAGEYKMQYDQTSAATGWLEVGIFEFDAGSSGYVSIGNTKSETLRIYGVMLERVETVQKDVFSDISDLPEKSEIALLEQLGIVSAKSGDLFCPYDNITRAEWAVWAAAAAGLAEQEDADQIFYDVPKTHFAHGAIAALYEAGAVSGMGNDAFGPDRAITEREGVTVLLKLMGYGRLVEGANYPGGYVQCAVQLGLGAGSDTPLTREKAAKIFAKALDCPLYEMEAGWNVPMFGQGDDTLLTRVFKIEPVEGIVTDNGISSLYGKSGIGKNQIAVDGVVYGCEAGDISDYLGVRVQAYVSTDEDDLSVKYVVLHKKVSSREIALEDLEQISGNSITYYNEAEAKKTIRFLNSAAVIYNGMAEESFQLELLLEDAYGDGRIIAFDNDGDGVYDVLNIISYQTYVVHHVNQSAGRIFIKDEGNHTTEIPADPETFLKIEIFEAGIKLDSIDKLKEWDVISVAQSTDPQGVMTIYRSSQKISGTITRISEEAIYVDGTERERCQNLYDGTGGFQAGNAYSFGLDHNGKIAWIRQIQNMAEGFGYLINYFDDEETQTQNFKILGQDGGQSQYIGSEGWRLNGVKFKTGGDTALLNENGETKQQLIKFSLNENGELKQIETAEDNLDGSKKGSFTLDFRNIKGNEGYVRTGTYKTIASRYIIPKDMLLFVVPQRNMSTKDMSRYYTADDSALIANTDYDFDGYNINENEEITVGVMYAAANVGLWARSPIMVVDQVSTAYNEAAGEPTVEISGYVNNEYTRLYTEDLDTVGVYRSTEEAVAAQSLERGDVIQYSLGKKGVIADKAFKQLLDISNPVSDENMVSSKDTVRKYSIYGDMYYAYGRVVKTQSNGFVFNTDAGNERLITMTAEIPIILVESGSRASVKACTLDELNAGDRVFITVSNTNTQMAVIYR